MKTSTIIISIFFVTQAFSQTKMLITDHEIQFEVTEEINQMYNFKFEKADSQFQILKKKYPKHPLPYFLLGYSQFWRIMPNERVTIYDDKFYAYMDTVIRYADDLYDEDEKNYEAIFFLTAAYAFKGRRQSDLEKWVPATNSARKALKYLHRGQKFEEFSPEFLFGEGLYNYFRQWIPENFKAFKIVMMFFAKGDKVKGIEQLKKCGENAFYTRVEAQHYLAKIYLFEENKAGEALPIAKYLHETYPDNSVFHRLYSRLYFQTGNLSQAELLARTMLKRVESNKPGYEAEDGRFATFFIGWNSLNKNKDTAKYYLEKCLLFCEKASATKMNYYFYSLDELAKMADAAGDKPKAMAYRKKITENASKKNDLYKSAKKYIKEND